MVGSFLSPLSGIGEVGPGDGLEDMLVAALHLAETGVSALVLEAEEIGFGGSGRKSAGIMADLILASSSRSRAALLANAGVSFDQRPALIDEAAVKEAMLAEGAPARDIADTLAELKAQRVAGRVPVRV